jgi:hypothetical protein
LLIHLPVVSGHRPIHLFFPFRKPLADPFSCGVGAQADRHEAEAERLRGLLTVRDAELATARSSAEEAAAEAASLKTDVATARASAEAAAAEVASLRLEVATARASAGEAASEAASLRLAVEAKDREIAELSQR